MSEQTVTPEQEVPATEGTNSLVTFLGEIEKIAPAIPAVVNAAISQIASRNSAQAGRNAASGNVESAISALVTDTTTPDAEHNARAEKILEMESVLNILRHEQSVSGAKIAESMKSDAVDDATFSVLDNAARTMRVQAVKLLESVLANKSDEEKKEILSHLPNLDGARKSGASAGSGTGTWRPYGRIFHVDGKVVPALTEGGKPNLAAAVKVLNDAGVECTADNLRDALGEKYGTESKSWADSQKSDALEFKGHKVWTTKDPTAGNKGATTAGDK